MDMTVNNPCWSKLQAPWLASTEAESEPARACA
jgi:nitrogenase molybdenum-iron protein alpha chain